MVFVNLKDPYPPYSSVSSRETQMQGRGRAAEVGTESATRVADVLLLFANEVDTLGVSEVGRRLGLSKAVVYRILQSLASREFLAFDKGTRAYRLGPAAAMLGARALRGHDLRRTALPVLRRLQEVSGETATVSDLVGIRRAYIDQVPSLKEIKMTVEVGRSFPLHAGASGRVILAFSPSDLRETVLSGSLEALTPLTPTERAPLEEELARVRKDETAVSWGERQVGAASVAAPVFGVDGYAIGSLSVCGPVDRFDDEMVERVRLLVKDAAGEVSRGLGWRGRTEEVRNG
jgi:DNA-binding IclR family transcriptional regulator